MALGVPGTGPYGKIRDLRQEIKDCQYELSLINQGIRRESKKKKLLETIAIKRAEIQKITVQQKAMNKPEKKGR